MHESCWWISSHTLLSRKPVLFSPELLNWGKVVKGLYECFYLKIINKTKVVLFNISYLKLLNDP